MTSQKKAGIYVGLTAALGIVALTIIAWQVTGFNSVDPRWWTWLGQYILETKNFPPDLLSTINYTLTVLVVITDLFRIEADDYGGAEFAMSAMSGKWAFRRARGLSSAAPVGIC